jgi:hypothetical protein
MAAKLKTKRISITTMGAKKQAIDIFQTPLSSHYPLPLIVNLKYRENPAKYPSLAKIRQSIPQLI